MTYSPNLPIGSGWKSTLNLAFQTLRRIKFLIPDDFTWEDFDPQPNFYGMTYTAGSNRVDKARGFRVGNTFFFAVNFSATFTGSFGIPISITIPYTIASPTGAAAACYLADGGVSGLGVWSGTSNTNNIFFYKSNISPYTAGVFNAVANGFLEVI